MRPLLLNHKETIEALVRFEREFSEDHGPFIFFGFLLTETEFTLDDYNEYMLTGGDWIVMASAPWSASYDNPAREAFSKGVRKVLELEHWWRTPHTSLLHPSDHHLEPIHNALEVEHDLVELVNVELFSREVRRAYIITCQRLSPVAAEGQE